TGDGGVGEARLPGRARPEEGAGGSAVPGSQKAGRRIAGQAPDGRADFRRGTARTARRGVAGAPGAAGGGRAAASAVGRGGRRGADAGGPGRPAAPAVPRRTVSRQRGIASQPCAGRSHRPRWVGPPRARVARLSLVWPLRSPVAARHGMRHGIQPEAPAPAPQVSPPVRVGLPGTTPDFHVNDVRHGGTHPVPAAAGYTDGMPDVTHILSAIEQGDPSAAEQLLPLVYDELRKLAAERLAQEKPGQTLQATALVHEVYLRLVDTEKA